MATRWNIQVDVDPKGVVTGAAAAGRAVDGMGKRVVATSTKMKALRTSMAGVARMAGLVLGPAMLAMFARGAIRKAVEQEKVLALVASQIRATGGAAGLSARQIADYAAELQRSTGVGDESILKSAGVLLSFKQISGDVFKDTLRLAQDMAVVMGTDLNSAVLQLSKALADPVARLGELSRAGIVFTQAQKDMVKEMVNAGQLMEAQKFILAEIESQYGGAAKAARDTLGGALQALGSEWGDLQELFVSEGGAGGALRTAVESWVRSIQWVKDHFGDLSAVWNLSVSKILTALGWLVEKFGAFAAFLDLVIPGEGGPGSGLAKWADTLAKDIAGMAEVFDDKAVAAVGRLSSSLDKRLVPALENATDATGELSAAQKKAAEDAKKMIAALEAATLKQWVDTVEEAAAAMEKLGTEMLDVSDIDLTAGIELPSLDDVFGEGTGAKFAAQDLAKELGDKIQEQVTQGLVNAFSSGDIDSAIDAIGNALSAAVSVVVSDLIAGLGEGLGAAVGAPVAGAAAGAVAGMLFDSIFGDDDDEELKRRAEEMGKLHDQIRSSMTGIEQTIIDILENILDLIDGLKIAGALTEEVLSAAGREIQSAVDAITGVSTEELGARLRAAVHLIERIGEMPAEIQEQFEGIDLGGLAESIAAEFMGITSHLDFAALEREANDLRSAIRSLGLDSGRTADLIQQVTRAERMRAREMRAGVMAQLATMMERAGIRSAEAARLRAKFEQIQFQVALKRLEVEIKLLDMWTKATAAIIGELSQFAQDLGNFTSSVNASFGGAADLNLPKFKGGGGRRGGGRKQKRKDLLSELERLMNMGGGNTFADRLRELNKQFSELRKRARKLKVPLNKVNAAYRVQLRLLREQAQASLRQFREGLISGPMSPMSLQQQFFRARSNFFNLQRRAAAGDLDATSQLGAAGQEYLELARQMFGSTEQFTNIFNEVLALVDGVLGVGGLKDEEASRHDQVLNQMEQSDELRMGIHDDAQEKRTDIRQFTRNTARGVGTMIEILERMEAG